MKAVRIHEVGGPEVMRLEELPEPRPARGEVLVAVEASGVNFIDVYLRTGLYKAPLPVTLGMEGAGTVIALGEGVTEVAIGARVAWAGVRGSYAEVQAVPVAQAVPVPDGTSTRDGAAAMLQGMTAHYLVTSTWPLARGQTCLVHAAAGGVGLLLCQMAKRCGATVIGTVSNERKAVLARDSGADHVIVYTERDFEAEVKRLTDGRGVDVVYDGVGASTFDKSLACLRRRGLLAVFGQSSGAVPPFDLQILNARGSLFVTRPTLAHYTATREELVARAGEVLGWIRDGKIRVHVGHAWPLAEVQDAHRALEGRRTTGKVLLLPREGHP